jgi:hypothetical protein
LEALMKQGREHGPLGDRAEPVVDASMEARVGEQGVHAEGYLWPRVMREAGGL